MRAYMPMSMAYVDLPEGVRVFSQLEGEVGSFQCNDEVEVVASPVRDNADGKPIIGYRFKKVSS